jgi:contractile injection system tube protein
MTSFPGSPKVLRAGIVVIDPDSAQVQRIITLQYNPDTLTRTLQAQAVGGDAGGRSEPLRFKGVAVETISFAADIDATDQLEFPEQNPDVVASGIQPQLALLESLVYPSSAQLIATDAEASSGTLEITPMLAPLPLLVWGKNRIVPVRLTNFSITEEAFNPALDPIRAKVTLAFRVLSVDDLGFANKGGSLFMAYLQLKEQLASKAPAGTFTDLGIGGIG